MDTIKERGEKILYSGTVVFNKDSYELNLFYKLSFHCCFFQEHLYDLFLESQ
jgi:hypothetical protein